MAQSTLIKRGQAMMAHGWHIYHQCSIPAFLQILAAGTIQTDDECVGCAWWSQGHAMMMTSVWDVCGELWRSDRCMGSGGNQEVNKDWGSQIISLTCVTPPPEGEHKQALVV